MGSLIPNGRDKAEYAAIGFGWWQSDLPGMCQISRLATRDSFLGMAPCGPLYSQGKESLASSLK